ncbi:MAG: DUF1674 domain-containing protein [Rickettsiales bacterium]
MDDPKQPELTSEAAAPAVEPTETAPTLSRLRLEPTRYGDWELNGKCVDF